MRNIIQRVLLIIMCLPTVITLPVPFTSKEEWGCEYKRPGESCIGWHGYSGKCVKAYGQKLHCKMFKGEIS